MGIQSTRRNKPDTHESWKEAAQVAGATQQPFGRALRYVESKNLTPLVVKEGGNGGQPCVKICPRHTAAFSWKIQDCRCEGFHRGLPERQMSGWGKSGRHVQKTNCSVAVASLTFTIVKIYESPYQNVPVNKYKWYHRLQIMRGVPIPRAGIQPKLNSQVTFGIASCHQRKKIHSNPSRDVSYSVIMSTGDSHACHTPIWLPQKRLCQAGPGADVRHPQSAPRWTPPRGTQVLSKATRGLRHRVDSVSWVIAQDVLRR